MEVEDPTTCRNYRNGTCPRSDTVILQEDSEYTQFGCRTCKCGWVVTMPTGKAKARHQNKVEAIRKQEEVRRARESQPVYFT